MFYLVGESLGPHEVSLFCTLITDHINTRAGTYVHVGQPQALSLAQILFQMNLTHLQPPYL